MKKMKTFLPIAIVAAWRTTWTNLLPRFGWWLQGRKQYIQVFAVIGSQLYAEFASKCFADLVTSAFVLVLFQAGKVSSKATQPVL